MVISSKINSTNLSLCDRGSKLHVNVYMHPTIGFVGSVSQESWEYRDFFKENIEISSAEIRCIYILNGYM